MDMNLSEEVKKLIIDSSDEMYSLRHPYVGSEHLFLAILKNKEYKCTKFLNKYNINYDMFRNELIRVIGIGTKRSKWLLFTPLFNLIINNSTKYTYDDNEIENVFISFMKSRDGIAKRILLGMNIDIYEIVSHYNSSCKDNILNNYDYSILDKYAINMNEYCSRKNDFMIYERDKEINLIEQILLKKNRNNILLIGDAGVGKTALLEGLVRRINNCDSKLGDYVIYNLLISSLVAGTKYRGEFEEKLNKIINVIEQNDNIILFIDEFHTVIGAGAADGAIDASNILKPYLSAGKIKVIGATTLEEYNKYLKNDKAFCRRFQNIFVKELPKESIYNILLNTRNSYEKYFNVTIPDNILSLILDISYSYFSFLHQPDVVIDFLDNICAKYSCNLNSWNASFSKEKAKLLNEKHVIGETSDENIEDELKKITINNKKLLTKSHINIIDAKTVYETLYSITGIPMNYIFDNLIAGIEKKLLNKYFWEISPISNLISILRSIINNMSSNKCLILYGNDTCGKKKIFKDFVNEFFIFANTIYIDSTEIINKEIFASISNNYFNLIICNFSSNNLILNCINKIKTKGFCLLVFFAENKPYNLGFIKENNSFYDYSVCFNDFSFENAKKYLLKNNVSIKNKEVASLLDVIDLKKISFDNIDKICKKYINI